MAKILIIEDDINIRNELQKLLINNNYDVDLIIDFENIELDVKYDVVLLDINLPGVNGFEICKKIKNKNEVPIIFVTSSTKEEDELKSIISGGDDFITKPYNTLILLEKIKRTISKDKKTSNITVKNVTLDLSTSTISYQNKEIELTRNERKIMYYFFVNPDKTITKSEFIEYLWNDKYYLDEGILIVNINRLRKKLIDIGLENFIITERKVGYRI